MALTPEAIASQAKDKLGIGESDSLQGQLVKIDNALLSLAESSYLRYAIGPDMLERFARSGWSEEEVLAAIQKMKRRSPRETCRIHAQELYARQFFDWSEGENYPDDQRTDLKDFNPRELGSTTIHVYLGHLRQAIGTDLLELLEEAGCSYYGKVFPVVLELKEIYSQASLRYLAAELLADQTGMTLYEIALLCGLLARLRGQRVTVRLDYDELPDAPLSNISCSVDSDEKFPAAYNLKSTS